MVNRRINSCLDGLTTRMTDNQTPYATLDPNVILDAVESLGFACNGNLFALNSYENRVYQVGIQDANPLIAKFYRPNRWTNETILEEHQFELELVEHEIPVVAPWANKAGETLHLYKDFRFALFPRWAGRALELDQLDQLTWMGRFIGRMHAIAAVRPFQHRMTLNVESYGHASYRYLIENNFVPEHVKANYCVIAETALRKIEQAFRQVDDIQHIRLHGDIHAGNVLWSESGPHIVDLDDCLMGPAIQDIWMLTSGNAEDVTMQLEHILHGYRQFHDFNSQELSLIEALRTLRMLHYSAWLARRWNDPAFPLSFPWFNTRDYWQKQCEQLAEQNDALDLEM